MTREEEVFQKYVKDRKVLIADPSAASRSGLFRAIHDLGAQTGNVILVNGFTQAQQALRSTRTDVVIVEYDLDRRCGLELLQTQREERPEETRNQLFVVVTGNTSQTAVARAAEEDIDAFILKPYTIDTVRRTLMQAAIRKIKPPEYYLVIEAAKKLIKDGKLDEAEKELTRAMSLDPSPALACYYLGQIQVMRKILEQGEGTYQKGLSYNRIHYKCMVGLYELMMQQNRHHDAYEAVKRISQYFPANPKRLTEVLRLAVMTSQFADIEKYYAAFTNIDERNETLVRYVCAALVVCGKHYLASGVGQSRAIELFKKAVATGQGRSKIIMEIVSTLAEHGLSADAAFFMERFPADFQGSDDFLFLRFLLADAEGQVSATLNQGRALMAKGYGDERLYRILLGRAVDAKLPERDVEEIQNRALSRFPDRKAAFDELLARARKARGAG